MAERIYTKGDAGLERLEQQPFESEDELQQLIAAYPELLDGEQMRPGDPRRWILITREQGIAETPGEHDRWAVDHLIIDQEAMPTLVEVKLRSNTEIRRTVVGQLLEYAAHAAQTWSADELRRSSGNPPARGAVIRTASWRRCCKLTASPRLISSGSRSRRIWTHDGCGCSSWRTRFPLNWHG